ncbi:hypothetical protein OsJ_12962 [Oryza sativa Japonica Group]|nr:hypothetical protein OsJ_12962 [Oryza sativa Japonica Group]
MGWSSTTARGVDTILKQFNVELINSARDHKRVLSSKASGEPPPLLASSVHCAMREAIRAARKEFAGAGGSALTFQMDVSLRPRRCRVVPRVANLIGSHRNAEISKILVRYFKQNLVEFKQILSEFMKKIKKLKNFSRSNSIIGTEIPTLLVPRELCCQSL